LCLSLFLNSLVLALENQSQVLVDVSPIITSAADQLGVNQIKMPLKADSSSPAANSSMVYSYTLSKPSITSAGIYDSEGTLVRTLWSNKKVNEGKHKVKWDGLLDDGSGAINQINKYVLKVLSNNMEYQWEGIIGNTSDHTTGEDYHRGFSFMSGMSIIGTDLFYCCGYSEGNVVTKKSSVLKPQICSDILPEGKTGCSVKFVVADNSTVYWAGYDSNDHDQSFVFGTRVSDNSEIIFNAGVPIKTKYGRKYPSTIDSTKLNKAPITGMALQKIGDYLFVSRQNNNSIHVINKKNGQLVRSIDFPSPKEMACDEKNNIWISSGINTFEKYSINSDGTLSKTLVSLSNLSDPKCLAIAPDDSTLLVTDAGNSHQVKAYQCSDGKLLWVFGKEGGYTTDVTISDDRFYFGVETRPFIAFQHDGSFWVNDDGSNRVMHFSGNRSFISRISYLPKMYSSAVIKNNPTRVFYGLLEFEIDYSKPLDNGINGSWKLRRNWKVIVGKFGAHAEVGVFKNILTFPNGRTYATVRNKSNSDFLVIELPDSGSPRDTGIILNNK
jgi:hypothetical protein